MLIARPLWARVGSQPAAGDDRLLVMAAVGVIAIPTYLDIATSIDSLRSPFAIGSWCRCSGDCVRTRLCRLESATCCSSRPLRWRSGSTGRA
jgi:hypothetical protein